MVLSLSGIKEESESNGAGDATDIAGKSDGEEQTSKSILLKLSNVSNIFVLIVLMVESIFSHQESSIIKLNYNKTKLVQISKKIYHYSIQCFVRMHNNRWAVLFKKISVFQILKFCHCR